MFEDGGLSKVSFSGMTLHRSHAVSLDIHTYIHMTYILTYIQYILTYIPTYIHDIS